jgi:hypothetical protein
VTRQDKMKFKWADAMGHNVHFGMMATALGIDVHVDQWTTAPDSSKNTRGDEYFAPRTTTFSPFGKKAGSTGRSIRILQTPGHFKAILEPSSPQQPLPKASTWAENMRLTMETLVLVSQSDRENHRVTAPTTQEGSQPTERTRNHQVATLAEMTTKLESIIDAKLAALVRQLVPNHTAINANGSSGTTEGQQPQTQPIDLSASQTQTTQVKDLTAASQQQEWSGVSTGNRSTDATSKTEVESRQPEEPRIRGGAETDALSKIREVYGFPRASQCRFSGKRGRRRN